MKNRTDDNLSHSVLRSTMNFFSNVKFKIKSKLRNESELDSSNSTTSKLTEPKSIESKSTCESCCCNSHVEKNTISKEKSLRKGQEQTFAKKKTPTTTRKASRKKAVNGSSKNIGGKHK